MVRILIFGAGSIGVYLGCVLHRAGHDTTLVGRRKLFSSKRHLIIDGRRLAIPRKAHRARTGTYDVVFVTTKLYDTRTALRKIRSVPGRPIIAIIQNGLVEPSFYGRFADDPRLVTIAVFQGYRLMDGRVITSHSKTGWVVTDSVSGNVVSRLLRGAGINASASKRIDEFRAEKMLLNCAVSALSAIYGVPVGSLLRDPFLSVCKALFDESYVVLSRIYRLPSRNTAWRRFARTIQSIGHHYSSMHQDIVSGRSTEIAFMNGYIDRMGRKLDIPTPVTRRIIRQLNAKTA